MDLFPYNRIVVLRITKGDDFLRRTVLRDTEPEPVIVEPHPMTLVDQRTGNGEHVQSTTREHVVLDTTQLGYLVHVELGSPHTGLHASRHQAQDGCIAVDQDACGVHSSLA